VLACAFAAAAGAAEAQAPTAAPADAPAPVQTGVWTHAISAFVPLKYPAQPRFGLWRGHRLCR